MRKPHSTPIAGVRLWPLEIYEDDRGTFTEAFREEWGSVVRPVQWNVVHSTAGVLRGVHVHRRHSDYLLLAAGQALIGVSDLRPDSDTRGAACLVELGGDQRRAIEIPPGVAHGFFFPVPSLHIYAVSHYWNLEDELGCRWDDPGLGIPWPKVSPLISPRDAQAGTLSQLLEELGWPAMVAPASDRGFEIEAKRRVA